jgi:HEAT repeat protein
VLAKAQSVADSNRGIFGLLALVVMGLSSSGCAEQFDAVWSRRFRNDPFHVMFGSDDPMYVLHNVEESDARVRAMNELKEPIRNGKSEEEQDKVIQILSVTASTDPHAVCRLSAIEALARFEDPRASQILVSAYNNAAESEVVAENFNTQTGVVQVKYSEHKPTSLSSTSSFTPDLVDQIQLHILASLGRTRSAAGLSKLCEVASKPPKKEERAKRLDSAAMFTPMGSEQGAIDIRLAALRSLAKYKGEPAAIDVCYHILQTEASVSMRKRAHDALIELTGKTAADGSAQAWAAVLGKVEAPPTNRGP